MLTSTAAFCLLGIFGAVFSHQIKKPRMVSFLQLRRPCDENCDKEGQAEYENLKLLNKSVFIKP